MNSILYVGMDVHTSNYTLCTGDSRDGSFCHVVIDMGENVCQHRIDQAKQWCVVPGKAPVGSESGYTPIRRD